MLLDLLKIDPGESGGEFLVIRAIDDFLIDRVVQRISDALARWVSFMELLSFCSLVQFFWKLQWIHAAA